MTTLTHAPAVAFLGSEPSPWATATTDNVSFGLGLRDHTRWQS